MANPKSKSIHPPLISVMRTILVTTMKKGWLKLTWILLIFASAAMYVRFNIRNNVDHSTTHILQENPIIANYVSNNPCMDNPPRHLGVPTFKHRDELGTILEAENMTVGVELGVKKGVYSSIILSRWPSCHEYVLVDVWAPQENYVEVANVDQSTHNVYYDETLKNTDPWKDKIHICRNFTSICVENYPDAYFDFIYVDARHDFKGVYADLQAWWPKLRVGGIMAGHDYTTQNDGPNRYGYDWTINYDGTKDETGTVVKGAVDKFSNEVCRQLTISYRERGWNTWAMRK